MIPEWNLGIAQVKVAGMLCIPEVWKSAPYSMPQHPRERKFCSLETDREWK